jgi:hypothetical protein
MAESSDRSSSRPPAKGRTRPPAKGGGRPPSKGGHPPSKGGRPPAKGGRPPSKGRADGRGGARTGASSRPTEPDAGPKHWGSLARKGARRLDEDPRGAGTALPSSREREPWQPEEWVDEGPLRDVAEGAVTRGRTGTARTARAEGHPESEVDVGVAELSRAVGPTRAAKVEKRLRDAADAFEHERFAEARSILAQLADQAPSSSAVRELHGVTLYRMGRWKKASEELEVFRDLSGSTEQHPVLADCYRAQKRYAQVDELWEELRAASPSAPLVTEGRIVTAGSLADRGRLDDAIALLAQGFRMPKRPKLHHLRRAYALADLEERAGDVPTARARFERIAAIDPDFADASARRRALG